MTEFANRPPEVKERMDSVVDSILLFANAILEPDEGEIYTISEIELAQHLRIAAIFYRAREDKNANDEPMQNNP